LHSVDVTTGYLTAFDYSITNPRQPNVPTKDIQHGESNKDEKVLVYIGYTAK
jgi:hypothetical protein